MSKTIDLFGSAFRLHAREAALLFSFTRRTDPTRWLSGSAGSVPNDFGNQFATGQENLS